MAEPLKNDNLPTTAPKDQSATAATPAPDIKTAASEDKTLNSEMLPGSRLSKIWAYTKAFAHDDELFIQSTAIKGGGVVAVMVGAVYMLPAAASLPWIGAAAVAGAATVVIGVGVAGAAIGANAFWNSLKRIGRKIEGREDPPEKKMTLAEAQAGLRQKIAQSKAVQAVKSWRVSKYIAGTQIWKRTMKNWNRAQMFLTKNSTVLNSFAAAGSAANIAAGVLMLTGGTVLFPLLLGGAAFAVTVGAAVGSILWGGAAGYVLAKNIYQKSQSRIENIKKHKKDHLLEKLHHPAEPKADAPATDNHQNQPAGLPANGALRKNFEPLSTSSKDAPQEPTPASVAKPAPPAAPPKP